MNTTTSCRASFIGLRPVDGFTLVELMVALAIGLITSLAIAQVLMFSEGYKRTATSGSDAQTNGSLALYTLQRDIQMAGYGFASDKDALGCPIHAKFNGADVATGAGVATFPTVLAPVVIDTTDVNRNGIRANLGGGATKLRVVVTCRFELRERQRAVMQDRGGDVMR